MHTHTHALPTVARSPQARAAPIAVRIGQRLRALVAALAAWRRARALEHEAVRAGRELAGMSAHVLRDIGAHDVAMRRDGGVEHLRHSALDLEIRG